MEGVVKYDEPFDLFRCEWCGKTESEAERRGEGDIYKRGKQFAETHSTCRECPD